jgi:hypothetical protein
VTYQPSVVERLLLRSLSERRDEAAIAKLARKEFLEEEVPAFVAWCRELEMRIQGGDMPQIPFGHYDALCGFMIRGLWPGAAHENQVVGLWASVLVFIIDRSGTYYYDFEGSFVDRVLKARSTLEPWEQALYAEALRAKARTLRPSDADRSVLDCAALLLDTMRLGPILEATVAHPGALAEAVPELYAEAWAPERHEEHCRAEWSAAARSLIEDASAAFHGIGRSSARCASSWDEAVRTLPKISD